jgi:hypothetical protein
MQLFVGLGNPGARYAARDGVFDFGGRQLLNKPVRATMQCGANGVLVELGQ